MTLIEVLLIVAVMLILAALFLPYLAKSRARSGKLVCVNHEKQIVLAFRIWSGDHDDLYPMLVSTNNGGTKEFVGNPDLTFLHFLVMSNELSSPKFLYCPNETNVNRVFAPVFDAGDPRRHAGDAAFTGNSNLSYFVGVDAVETNAMVFLVGDRNITNGTPVQGGLLSLTTSRLSGWTSEMHVRKGNVAFADGSVESLKSKDLRLALERTGVPVNRLALP